MQAISRAGGNVRCRLLLRVRRLWQFQRAEVVIADPFPVLVGVAEGVARAANARAKKARAAKFIMKVSAVLPHELSLSFQPVDVFFNTAPDDGLVTTFLAARGRRTAHWIWYVTTWFYSRDVF